jgi:AraC-like DNA-binding protein
VIGPAFQDKYEHWHSFMNAGAVGIWTKSKLSRMNQIICAIGYLAISQLLLIVLYYLGFHRQRLVARLIALLCICLIAVVVWASSFVESSFTIRYLLVRLVFATPAVLWLVAHFAFEDNHFISPLMWLVLLGYQVVHAIGSIIVPELSQTFGYLSQISYPFMLGLIIHVIIVALRGKSGDLVEPRRRVRVPFAVCLAVILAAMIAIAMVISLLPSVPQSLILSMTIFSNGLLFLLAFTVNLTALGFADQSESEVKETRNTEPFKEDPHEKRQSISPRILNRIRELMIEQKLYRDSSLTIGVLADKVHASEHKVRYLINKEQGYRNFNQFLNQYRVAEAKELLLKSVEMPIYDVALEIGYSSLSSFNKAFKEITGVTPTNYRNNDGLGGMETKENLVESNS